MLKYLQFLCLFPLQQQISICGYGGIGRRAGFRFQWATVWVRLPLPVPRRSKVRFAPTFFMPAAKRRDPLSPLRPSPNRPHCAGLRFDSGASRYFFVHKKVRFNRPFQKKDMTKKSCLSFGVSAALRPPPLGISMLGRAKPSLRNSSVLRTCELTAHQRHRPEGRR